MQRLNNADKVWFASDLHQNHKNIIRGLSSWDNGGDREFDSIQHMNETILGNVNKYVEPDHILILLGDTLFGDKDYLGFADRVACQNIWIMPGNHCHTGRLYGNKLEGKYTALGGYEEFKIDGQLINCCHYPILSFNHMSRGAWMLYGHVHAKIQRSDHEGAKYFNSLKTLDVGIDNANDLLGEYRPFNMARDIAPFMRTQDKKSQLDHH
mgnify:CR=1 FL=1